MHRLPITFFNGSNGFAAVVCLFTVVQNARYNWIENRLILILFLIVFKRFGINLYNVRNYFHLYVFVTVPMILMQKVFNFIPLEYKISSSSNFIKPKNIRQYFIDIKNNS